MFFPRMMDEPIAGFWLVLASKLSSAGKALARSVAANQVPIGPSCGLDGLVGQYFDPNKGQRMRLSRIVATGPVGKFVVGVARRIRNPVLQTFPWVGR